MLAVSIMLPMISPAKMSIGWWAWSCSLESEMIITRIVEIRLTQIMKPRIAGGKPTMA